MSEQEQEEGLKRVFARIPEDLAREWRVALARRGESQQMVLERMVRGYVEKFGEGREGS